MGVFEKGPQTFAKLGSCLIWISSCNNFYILYESKVDEL
jgi:hypothetical protein